MKRMTKGIVGIVLVAALSIGGYSVFADNPKEAYRALLRQQVETKLADAYQDAANSFDFDTTGYTLYRADTTEKVEGMSKEDYVDLRFAMTDTIFKQKKIHRGDLVPGMYIKDNLDEAVVLLKTSEGVNKLFRYQKNDAGWTLVEEKEAAGKEVLEQETKTYKQFVEEQSVSK